MEIAIHYVLQCPDQTLHKFHYSYMLHGADANASWRRYAVE